MHGVKARRVGMNSDVQWSDVAGYVPTQRYTHGYICLVRQAYLYLDT